MPDRFRRFTEGEIHEMRYALESALDVNDMVGRPNDDVERLLDEIKHEQLQQAHRAHRELLPS